LLFSGWSEKRWKKGILGKIWLNRRYGVDLLRERA
jgi:hypothetical protein